MMPQVLRDDHPEALSAVLAALETGGTIVFPTDTIYGIGGNPWDGRCLERVRTLKERPPDRPFALLLPLPESIERYASLDGRTRRWIDRSLPGPVTFLLPATGGTPPASAADGKVGIRVPFHPFFQGVLARLDRPLFGTSVNRHGEPPLVDVDEIIDRFPAVDLIVTGSTGRAPSAILDLTVRPARLIRGDLPPPLRPLLDEEQNGHAADREERPRDRAEADRLPENEAGEW